jgi:hypothetical protein
MPPLVAARGQEKGNVSVEVELAQQATAQEDEGHQPSKHLCSASGTAEARRAMRDNPHMPSPTEASAFQRRLGKWSVSGVPHKGWTCTNTEDLGSKDMKTCEMCERTEIRYAHTMTHPDYKGPLVVGEICAGHMEGDLLRAKNREREVRNRVGRRVRWPHSKWKISKSGNEYRNHGGYNCVLKEWPQGWQVLLRPLPDGELIPGKKRFATPEAAKLAAFDYIETHPHAPAKVD